MTGVVVLCVVLVFVLILLHIEAERRHRSVHDVLAADLESALHKLKLLESRVDGGVIPK